MDKKPSTADILAQIRKKDASASGNASSPDAPVAAEPSVVEAAATSAAATPQEAPKGTAGILASIRASKAAADSGSAPAATSAAPAPSDPKSALKGTAGILASIRGGGAATGGSTTVPAPVAKKTAPAVPAGDLPPVKDMLERLKAGAKAVPTPAKPELKIPVRPSQKAAAPKATRRGFLLALVATPFALAWTALSAMTGVWVLALARFMFPNVLVEPPSQFKIGGLSDYPLGTVSTKWTAARGIWVVHTDQYKGRDQIYVLASVCTHLGCTPSWLEGEQKFKCPCHGSGFYINGINFEGPAPRPLERVGLKVASDGSLEVDKSVKFQEEKGQWEDAKSFVDGTLV